MTCSRIEAAEEECGRNRYGRGFRPRIRYKGLAHTVTVTVINAALLVGLVVLWRLGRSRPHFLLSFAFRWLAWFWLTLYAIPYLGETP